MSLLEIIFIQISCIFNLTRAASTFLLSVLIFFKIKGTNHGISCPYPPQQNSGIGQKHCHVMENVMSMLHYNKIIFGLWINCLFMAKSHECMGASAALCGNSKKLPSACKAEKLVRKQKLGWKTVKSARNQLE